MQCFPHKRADQYLHAPELCIRGDNIKAAEEDKKIQNYTRCYGVVSFSRLGLQIECIKSLVNIKLKNYNQ